MIQYNKINREARSMGLFAKLFAKNKGNVPSKRDTEKSKEDLLLMNYDKEINFLLEVLGHLGLLDSEKIEKNLISSPYFDRSILARLMIEVSPEHVDHLKKYFNFNKMGYGSEKLALYKKRLYEYAKEKIRDNRNQYEVVEELISIVRVEIINYEIIINELNKEVARIEKENKNNTEVLAMVDYLMNQYEETELGYPVNLDNRIRTMANELSQLPYGGYGEKEIDAFILSANKIVEEGRNKGEESSQILNRLNEELFYPKKKRFSADLDTLNKKLGMIQDSTYLTDLEKEQNCLKTIDEFNQMNGHKVGVKETISRLKKSLESLEYGGFGEEITKLFQDKVEAIHKECIEEGIEENQIIKEIREEYYKLTKEYNVHLKKLKERIKNIEDDDTIVDKKIEIDELVQFFQDEMGHPINYYDRIENMCEDLRQLPYGGYSEDQILKFKEESLEKAKKIESHDELANCMKQIHRKYRDMVREYNKEVQNLKQKEDDIKNSNDSELEKEEQSNHLVNSFQIKFGHKVDFNELIESNAKTLGSLEKGGYGKKVLDEYREECKKLLDLEDDSNAIYDKIEKKFYELKNYYYHNLEIFNEWKELQLKNKKGQEKEELEKDIDTKITYMLSLSPTELYDYYMEDDRKKKAQAYRHNYMAAYRYLAREEAKKKKNQSLYERRLKELQEGKQIYSSEEIENATKKLESNSENDETILDEDRIISLIEYIDSTLFRQMLYAETTLAHKKGQTKI